jgi:hypothetical protein
MPALYWLLVAAIGWATATATEPAPAVDRPRVVIMSDFPPLGVIPGGAEFGPEHLRSDPDDVQSMIRLLLYANDLEIVGLVASAATLANRADKQGLLDLVALYERVQPNLQAHDPRYPAAAALRAVTWQGRSGSYGRPVEELLGAERDSEASEAIIALVDQPDPRPIWFLAWGGPRELAQALWQVRATRTPEQVERFEAKLRVYLIALQDGSGAWLLEQFPRVLIIHSAANWRGMFWNAPGADTSLADLQWINRHVRWGHGVLGALYPECAWDHRALGVVEGDTPSFLHLVSAVKGINDAEHPDQPGWGGVFVRAAPDRPHWIDSPMGAEAVWRWRPAVQADFALRTRWMRDPAPTAP